MFRVAVEGLGATVGPYDGAAHYLSGLVHGMSRQPCLEVLVIHGPSMSGHIDMAGLAAATSTGGSGRISRVVAQHSAVPFQAKKWGAEAVVYSGNYLPLLSGPPAIAIVQNMLLVEETNTYGRALRTYRRWQLSRIAKYAAGVVAVSGLLAEALTARFPHIGNRVHIVKPGIDEYFFGRHGDMGRSGRWRATPYFLCVGTAWPYRDYELALSALAASGLKQDLVIAGATTQGDRTRLRRHATSCGVGNALKFAGVLTKPNMYLAYRDATALIASSRLESFALSTVEAMAVGTPVVAADRTVYPETLAGAGLLCQPSAACMGEGLHSVTESTTRTDLIARGRKRAAEAHWDESARMIVRIAREVSDGTC